jgi:hypothetical protein
MKKIIIILFCILLCINFIYADTGTYEIKEQRINLTIQSDRNVVIDYYAKWKVTGGNIPWVTVGLPNSNYAIQSYGGAASSVKPYNGGGWTGVRVDLDKTYLPDDEFDFNVKVLQSNFVYKYGENASIQYTPVWWDNSVVEYASIEVFPPNGITGVSTSSEPTAFQNGSILWEFNNIERGGKRTVGIIMPIDAFPGLNETANTNTKPISLFGDSGGSIDGWTFGIIALVIGGVIFLIILMAIGKGMSDYDSPSMSLSSALSEKEVTRRVTLKCPNDDTILEKKNIKDVNVDYCPTCGGIFYDKGEVESLIKKGVNEDEFYK